MEANPARLAATMHDVQYLQRNCNEALFTGGLQKKHLREEMRIGALAATFEQKHLITEKSKHGGMTQKDLEEKTAKILKKELGKMDLGLTESTRTTNTVLLMTPDEFQSAVDQAR
jgi:hypothetical protein